MGSARPWAGVGGHRRTAPGITQEPRPGDLVNLRGPSVGVAALSEAGFWSPAEAMIPLKFSAFSLSHVLPPVWEAFYSFNLCWSASKSGTRQSLLEELGVVEAHPGLEGEPPGMLTAGCLLQSPSSRW